MMAQADSLTTSFVDALWPVRGTGKMLRAAILAFLGSALLTLSAKVQVPFYPVPMTMQTLVVLLVGMAFGARLGVATVALYLAEGAAGLPVFAGTPEKGIGLAYMMGPTGGYLLGFVLAAAIAGWMVERRRDAAGLALAVVAGSIAIYGPGVLWLARFVGAGRALELGLVPFLGGDLLKAGLAFTLALCGAAMVRRRHGA
jgi:biotin transport system substrate-specific component